MSQFKPLLAETVEDLSQLRFPVMASAKLDGIRCVKLDGKALSRKLKPIPNKFVREWVEANLPDGVDGELMLRDHRTPFNEVSSAIMRASGQPDFTFQAFDFIGVTLAGVDTFFQERYKALLDLIDEDCPYVGTPAQRFFVVNHDTCDSQRTLDLVVAHHLDQGYEGTMVRDPNGRYKFGRSTLKEGILLKIKPFIDEEATVVALVEQMHNENEEKRDALGNMKRSSKQEGKRPAGVLGALACVTEDGAEFEIGTGFTSEMRCDLWKHAQAVVGRQVKFKSQGQRAPGQSPRFPVFLGWRED